MTEPDTHKQIEEQGRRKATPMTHLSPFKVDEAGCDQEYFTIEIDKIASLVIKRETEGIVLDIYPICAEAEPVASMYVLNEDLIATPDEDTT